MTENDKQLYQLTQGITRIANYIHEILVLIKKDQEESKKRWEKESEQTSRASNGPRLPAALAMAPGSGSKLQAASCKRQAASLTRLNYNVIVSYKLKEKKV